MRFSNKVIAALTALMTVWPSLGEPPNIFDGEFKYLGGDVNPILLTRQGDQRAGGTVRRRSVPKMRS
jgi:hypothetical protein